MEAKQWIRFDESSLEVLKTLGMKYLAFMGDEEEDMVNIYPFKSKDKAELFMIANGFEESNNLVPVSDNVVEIAEDIEPSKVRVLFS